MQWNASSKYGAGCKSSPQLSLSRKRVLFTYYYKGEYWNFIARNASKYLTALTIMENKYWNYPTLVQSQVTSYTRTQNRRIMRLSTMSVV